MTFTFDFWNLTFNYAGMFVCGILFGYGFGLYKLIERFGSRVIKCVAEHKKTTEND